MIQKIKQDLFSNKKEFLLYFVFGFAAFVICMLSYAYFDRVLGWDALIANVLSWIVAVLFSFITNKLWVFSAPAKTVWRFIAQLVAFFSGRVLTLIVEEVIILVFVTILRLDSMMVKLVAQIIVVILNYVISKLLVFRKN